MNERLERGIDYALQGWTPVSEATLKDVRQRAARGDYRNNSSIALKDVRRDPSLFLLMLKRFCEATNAEGALQNDPADFFSTNCNEAISEILETTPGLVSSHRMGQATADQIACVTRSAIATSAAEKLGSHSDLSPDVTFMTASLRQLGHLLIAWNYPHIYSRVLRERNPDASIDQSLAALLGFSPTLLAVSIAQRWRIAPEICAALGDQHAVQLLSSDQQKRSALLQRICEAGEALARSMYPEHFPNADQDWHDASTYIRHALGPRGLEAVLSSVRSYVEEFQSNTPEISSLPSRLVMESAKEEPQLPKRKLNKYLDSCPFSLQVMVESIYEQMPSNGISRDALDTLLKRAIPLAGFDRGVVYLLDPDSMLLKPRVAIGQAQISDLPSHSFSGRSNSAISAALHSVAPHESHVSEIDGTTQSAIAGSLGVEHKTGVLYLEVGDMLRMRPAQDRLQLFKALRQTLNDALRLE